MKISALGVDRFQIDLSREELWILHGCVNEALELGEEFQMRVGATEAEALALLNSVGIALEAQSK